jgi:hypothetical protein
LSPGSGSSIFVCHERSGRNAGTSKVIVDMYNALNGSAVLSEVTTYGPRWRTPTEILAGRFFKLGIQANF